MRILIYSRTVGKYSVTATALGSASLKDPHRRKRPPSLYAYDDEELDDEELDDSVTYGENVT